MPEQEGRLAGPAIMLLSALIFGFFGFLMRETTVDGEWVLFFALLTWTLRISAGLFVVSAVVTFAAPVAGNLLYALVGVVGAGLFVVVAVMDIADPHNAAVPWWLLLVFAAWNGYGSWFALRAVLAGRADKAIADGRSRP